MVRLKFDIELNYEIAGSSSDFIFNIHAAQTAHQTVVNEQLYLSQPVTPVIYTDPTYGTRYFRLKALAGPLTIRYNATVDISHYFEPPENLLEMPVAELPSAVLHYIYPSRYCQSDRMGKLATWEFGHFQPGYPQVHAIQDWVRQRTALLPGSSDSHTSATDTLIDQAGVCRDFAHLMIALCRAMSIPTRFAAGITYGANQKSQPPDFHAYVEVFLSNRWYIFDPSGLSIPMGLIRIGTGRDAADASFATVFGAVATFAPLINITAIDDPGQGFIMPHPRTEMVSTQSQ